MAILTNSQGRKLYVLRKISTGEIISRNVLYPNAVDDAPIQGLDPDLEYLAIDQGLQPVYDSRFFILQQQEGKDATVTPAVYRITFSAVRRDTADIITALANVESFQNDRVVDPPERMKLIFLGLGVLFQITANQTLTAKQTAVKNKILGQVAKITTNSNVRETFETQITAGGTPDLDAPVWAADQ
jgi:hypothetical protein